jgi:hypothetical protein
MADNNQKDALIETLQNELVTLKHQIKEFQDLRMSIVKVTGKNSVKKLKDRMFVNIKRQVKCKRDQSLVPRVFVATCEVDAGSMAQMV